MNSAEVIRRYGKQIHALGVALYAFVEANPGCTYDDIKNGLAMGRSTVIEYVNRLSDLGILTKNARENGKGIPLPTLLNVANNTVQQMDSSKTTCAPQEAVNTTVHVMEGVQQVDSTVQLMDGENAANNTVHEVDSSKQYRPPTRGRKITPHTPLQDNLNINTHSSPTAQSEAGAKTRPAKVVQHPSARIESDHQRMMRHFAGQTGAIPDGKAQGEAVRWLLSHGYSADEAIACLDDFLAELRDGSHWRKSRVSWLTVKKEIGAWKLRGVDDGQAAERSPNGATGHSPQAGRGGTARDERRYAELARQDPASILGGSRASTLDGREPDRKAASPTVGDYDASYSAVHFR